MEKEIKLSFLKRLKMSIFDFDKYHIIAGEGLGRAMMYLVKLILLFSLIISLSSTFKYSQIINEAIGYVKNNVPNFYFKNNSLTVESEEDVIIENHEYTDFKIILSNSETYNEDILRDFDGISVALVKNKVLFKQANSTSIITQSYEEISNAYDINQINKEFIVNSFNGQNAYYMLANIFAVVFVATFLTYFMTAILDTIALSLLGFIVSRIIRLPLKYGSIYSISVSSITLSVIINLIYMIVNLFTGFVIPYFQVMYTLVSYVYLIAVLFILRSEIIKKKVQLQVTIVNQKNNKDEDIKKEEDKKEKNTDNKENKNKEDKKDKEGKDELKDKAKETLKNNKDNPEPQANIRER